MGVDISDISLSMITESVTGFGHYVLNVFRKVFVYHFNRQNLNINVRYLLTAFTEPIYL